MILTYAIGDIHGRLDLLKALLKQIEDHSAGEDYKLIFIGDYIDRGPDSKGVVDTLKALREERGKDRVVLLMGNHEDMAHDAHVERERDSFHHWAQNGGYETLESYGSPLNVPKELNDFILTLDKYHEDGLYIFVHAGIDDMPFIPMNQQPDSFLLWKRFYNDYNPGIAPKILVHGHTPTRKPEMLPNRINIDTGAVFYGKLTALVIDSDGNIADFVQADERFLI